MNDEFGTFNVALPPNAVIFSAAMYKVGHISSWFGKIEIILHFGLSFGTTDHLLKNGHLFVFTFHEETFQNATTENLTIKGAS